MGQDWLAFFRQDEATGQFYFGLPPPGSVSLWTPAFLFNPPAWSLAVEFTFYVLAPILVRQSLGIQGVVLAASLSLRTFFYYAAIWPVHNWICFFSPSALCFFMAGSLAYRFYRAHQARLTAFASSHWWIFLAFGLLILFYRRLPSFHNFDLILIPLAVAMVPLLFAFTRTNRVDRLVGELSYPFYLFHWNLIVVLGAIAGGNQSLFFEPACLAVTLVCSWLFYQFIESRTERFRGQLYQRHREKEDLDRQASMADGPEKTANG